MVFTLLKVGGREQNRRFVAKRAIELMHVLGTGQFIYKKTRRFTNRINYTFCTPSLGLSRSGIL